MNLHQMASGMVGAVNPFVPVSIQVSTGYTTAADGKRAPTYAPFVIKPGQLQSLTFRDLTQIEGLNLQGTRRAIYVNGRVDGLIRGESKGGDLITFPDGTVWLVAIDLEAWPDWCKLAATLQVS